MLRDAVDAHGGDRGEHHADGEQAEELAGDGVSGVLQRQPQAPPHAATVQLLELLDVPAAVEGAVRRQRSLQTQNTHSTASFGPVQVGYFVQRCVNATGVALVIPAAASAALQFAVVVAVAAARVQEELVDAPVLNFLAVRGGKERGTNTLLLSFSSFS